MPEGVTVHDPIEELAAALALIARGNAHRPGEDLAPATLAVSNPEPRADRVRGVSSSRDTASRPERSADLVSYHIEVGARHGAKPGNIVGAIANEAGLDSSEIRAEGSPARNRVNRASPGQRRHVRPERAPNARPTSARARRTDAASSNPRLTTPDQGRGGLWSHLATVG